MTSRPEEFIARDGSLMRLIPGGVAIFGSTREEIRAAARLDKDGALFPLENETPQFETFVSSYYLGVYAVTNQQFARFLSETRTPAPLLNILIPGSKRFGCRKPRLYLTAWYRASRNIR
jgi:formylglycine-generating enzyme required for sulfatase activity